MQKQHFDGAFIILAFIDTLNILVGYDNGLPIATSNNVSFHSRIETKNLG
jgi:ribonucleotide reductase alpha subunit